MLGAYVRALVMIVFWLIVAAAVVACGCVAMSGIWFAAQAILKAVGLW